MPIQKRPDARLMSAVPYVKPGGAVADIGTDHAYLPIELVRMGIVQKALACDINRGPIERAEQNIRAAGMQDKISTLQTDGLQGVEAFAPDDIIIFGMGGELIAEILSKAPWVKNREIGLILQPMTKAEALRKWLYEQGFAVIGETLTDEMRYYQTIHARYTGVPEPYTEEELLFGKRNLAGGSLLLPGLIRRTVAARSVIAQGRQQGGADVSAEEAFLERLKQLLADLDTKREKI